VLTTRLLHNSHTHSVATCFGQQQDIPFRSSSTFWSGRGPSCCCCLRRFALQEERNFYAPDPNPHYDAIDLRALSEKRASRAALDAEWKRREALLARPYSFTLRWGTAQHSLLLQLHPHPLDPMPRWSMCAQHSLQQQPAATTCAPHPRPRRVWPGCQGSVGVLFANRAGARPRCHAQHIIPWPLLLTAPPP